MNDEITRMLTVSQAAEKLKVARQRVHQYIEAYGLDPIRLANGTVLLSPDEMAEIRRKRKQGTKTGN